MVIKFPHRMAATASHGLYGDPAPVGVASTYPPSRLDRVDRLPGARSEWSVAPEPHEPTTPRGRSCRVWPAVFAAGAAACVVALTVGLSVGLTQKRHQAPSPNEGSGSFNQSFPSGILTDWRIFDGTSNGGAFRCGFSKLAVNTSRDALLLSVTARATSNLPASCAQLSYKHPVSYGRFSASVQPTQTAGIVTAFFLYAETSAGQNQEIDIEWLGKDTSLLTATSYRDANATTDTIPLSRDAAAAPHVYAFDWQPTFIAWSVDGQERYRQTKGLPRYTQQTLLLNAWLREPSEFAGLYDPLGPVPTGTSRVQWVAYEPRTATGT